MGHKPGRLPPAGNRFKCKLTSQLEDGVVATLVPTEPLASMDLYGAGMSDGRLELKSATPCFVIGKVYEIKIKEV